MKSKFGDSEDGILIEVSLHIRQKEAQKAVDLLTAYIKGNPNASDALHFALAQVNLSEGIIF